jgi:flagellar FliL protein
MLGLGKKKGKKGGSPEAEGTEAEKLAAIAAEGESAAEAEGEVKKKGLPIKLIAIAAVVLLVLAGGGGAAFVFMNKSKTGAHAPVKAKAKAKAKDGKAEAKAGEVNPHGCTMKDGPEGVSYCTLPAILTNTATTEGRPNNLKLQVTLELADPATGDVIGEQMPRLNDLLQTYLRELRPEDLSGSAGDFRLRQEIQHRVNLVIAPAKVNAVLIEEMLQS